MQLQYKNEEKLKKKFHLINFDRGRSRFGIGRSFGVRTHSGFWLFIAFTETKELTYFRRWLINNFPWEIYFVVCLYIETSVKRFKKSLDHFTAKNISLSSDYGQAYFVSHMFGPCAFFHEWPSQRKSSNLTTTIINIWIYQRCFQH